MPVITDQQIANSALAGGFIGDEVRIATAVALAESGGNSDATHKNVNGTTDYGVWQINSVHLKPGGLLPGVTADELLANPVANARAAHTVFVRQGWQAWTTYKTGKYLLFIPRAAAVVKTASAEGGGSGEGVTKTVNPLTEIASVAGAAARAGGWLANPHNWLRIGQVVLGGAVIVVGVSMIVSGKNPVRGMVK